MKVICFLCESKDIFWTLTTLKLWFSNSPETSWEMNWRCPQDYLRDAFAESICVLTVGESIFREQWLNFRVKNLWNSTGAEYVQTIIKDAVQIAAFTSSIAAKSIIQLIYNWYSSTRNSMPFVSGEDTLCPVNSGGSEIQTCFRRNNDGIHRSS